jgi:hypothetical protein
MRRRSPAALKPVTRQLDRRSSPRLVPTQGHPVENVRHGDAPSCPPPPPPRWKISGSSTRHRARPRYRPDGKYPAPSNRSIEPVPATAPMENIRIQHTHPRARPRYRLDGKYPDPARAPSSPRPDGKYPDRARPPSSPRLPPVESIRIHHARHRARPRYRLDGKYPAPARAPSTRRAADSR